MKRIGKWLLGLITSALTLVLVIVLLPYAAKWVARIMPDESAAAIRASVVLSQKLEQSAKLETLHVTEEGALNYEVKAAFLGTVASINADYTYEGSFGIDLQQVTMTRDGSVLTLTLPAPELLLDSLTPADITRDLALYPYLDDNDLQRVWRMNGFPAANGISPASAQRNSGTRPSRRWRRPFRSGWRTRAGSLSAMSARNDFFVLFRLTSAPMCV